MVLAERSDTPSMASGIHPFKSLLNFAANLDDDRSDVSTEVPSSSPVLDSSPSLRRDDDYCRRMQLLPHRDARKHPLEHDGLPPPQPEFKQSSETLSGHDKHDLSTCSVLLAGELCRNTPLCCAHVFSASIGQVDGRCGNCQVFSNVPCIVIREGAACDRCSECGIGCSLTGNYHRDVLRVVERGCKRSRDGTGALFSANIYVFASNSYFSLLLWSLLHACHVLLYQLRLRRIQYLGSVLGYHRRHFPLPISATFFSEDLRIGLALSCSFPFMHLFAFLSTY